MDHFLFLLLCVLAALALAGWIYLFAFRGAFWRARPRLEETGTPPGPGPIIYPAVAAVVPARDEAEAVGISLESLFAQDYPGDFRVILVDDGSTDGTADIARETAASMKAGSRFEILRGADLPRGWTGKLWAVAQGVERAEAAAPEFLWLTDADIFHDSSELRDLVGIAQGQSRDLVSLMVLLRCESNWEKLLIPAFVFFFQMLYPFSRVNDPKRREAAAAGGSMLVRSDALAAAGGIEAIKSEVIDDCALARLIKKRGAIWIGLTAKTRSLRRYESLAEIWDMVARSAYAQLDYSPLLLAGAVTGMAIVFIAPLPVTAILAYAYAAGPHSYQLGAGPAAAAFLLSMIAYQPSLALYKLDWRWGTALTVAAGKYCAMTVDSARRHWRGMGGGWKGRTYAPAARRRQ